MWSQWKSFWERQIYCLLWHYSSPAIDPVWKRHAYQQMWNNINWDIYIVEKNTHLNAIVPFFFFISYWNTVLQWQEERYNCSQHHTVKMNNFHNTLDIQCHWQIVQAKRQIINRTPCVLGSWMENFRCVRGRVNAWLNLSARLNSPGDKSKPFSHGLRNHQ